MNREKLEKLVENELSQRQIADTLNVSQATVKYWLKKHKLKTTRSKNVESYLCKSCGCSDKARMMNKGNGRKSQSLCKKCHNENTIKKGRKNKDLLLLYKGGKCERCEYNECSDALEFHHVDPKSKDPSFQSLRHWSLEKAKKEVDKCMLLCSNCHRAKHAGVW